MTKIPNFPLGVNISGVIATELTTNTMATGDFYGECHLLEEINKLVSQITKCPERFYDSLTQATKGFNNYEVADIRIILYDIEVLRSLMFELILIAAKRPSEKSLNTIRYESEYISQSPERVYCSLVQLMVYQDDFSGDYGKRILSDLELFRDLTFRLVLLALVKKQSAA